MTRKNPYLEYRHPAVLKFWENVLIGGFDQCWPWVGTINEAGYGKWYFKDKDWRAHRLAFLFTRGELTDGTLILHKCDNRDCCNPTHIREGTHQDNMDDMKSRGRARNRFSVLTLCE